MARALILISALILPSSAMAQSVPEGAPQFLPATVAPSRDGVDRRVRITNQTGLVVRIFQAGDERSGEFGENLIAGQPMAAGEQRILVIDNGRGICRFVLRAELSSGQEVIRRDVNVCTTRDLALTR